MDWVGVVVVVAAIGAYGALRWHVFRETERWRRFSAEAAPEVYRRRVEAEVAKRLDAERFEADVQRRLEAARSTIEIREEV